MAISPLFWLPESAARSEAFRRAEVEGLTVQEGLRSVGLLNGLVYVEKPEYFDGWVPAKVVCQSFETMRPEAALPAASAITLAVRIAQELNAQALGVNPQTSSLWTRALAPHEGRSDTMQTPSVGL